MVLKDLFTLHKLAALTVKTDDITRGRKDLDPHGRFWGEWVKVFFLGMRMSGLLDVT